MSIDQINTENREIFNRCIHEQEIETLIGYYDEFSRQIQAGKIQEKMRIVNITGTSGSGKDYIAKQFLKSRKIDFYLTNPGHSYFQDSNKIWCSIFSKVLKIDDGDAESVVTEKIRMGFTTLGSVYPSKDELYKQQPLIEQIFRQNSEKMKQKEIQLAAYTLLSATAYWFKQSRQKPFVIFLNNVDIFPEEFINFIGSAVFFNSMDSVNNAIFMVLTSDHIANLVNNITNYSDYKEIKINPLNMEQITNFLFQSGVDLPKVYLDYINKIKGNLFFYKILLDLYLGGYLYEEETRDRLLKSEPPVLELLNIYSGKLGDGFLHLFQIAALIGTVFNKKMLKYLCMNIEINCPDSFFKNNLLIEELKTDLPDSFYRFKHEVIKECYLSLVDTIEKNRILDLLVEYYQANTPKNSIAHVSEIIGGYLMSAGHTQEAVYYFRMAEELEFSIGNYRNAAKIIKIILHVLPKNTDEWLDSILKLGSLKLLIQSYDEAIQILETGLNYLKRNTNPNKTWQFLNETAKAYFAKNDLEHTLGIYERISRLSADMGDQDKLGMALNKIGEIETSLGNYEKAAKILNHVSKNRNNFTDPEIYPKSMAHFGIIKYNLADYESSLGYFKTGLDSLPDEGHDLIKAKFNGYFGVINYCLKKYDEALEWYNKQLAIAYRLGDHSMIGDALGNIGLIYSSNGDYERAIQNYKKQLAVYMQEKSLVSIVLCYNNIGGIYMSIGNLVQALSYYSKALDLSTKVRVKGYEARLSSNVATVYELLNEFEEAKKYCNRAIEININNKADYYLLKHYDQKGAMLFKQGGYAEALQIFRANLELAKSNNNNFFCQRSLFMIDLILAAAVRNPERQKQIIENLSARYEIASDDTEKADMAYSIYLTFKSSKDSYLISVAQNYADKALLAYTNICEKNSHFVFKKRITEVAGFINSVSE